MVKRTYIKLLGPPLLKSLRALEKVSINMPEFCIMDTIISNEIPEKFSSDVGGERYRTSIPRDPIIANYALNYFKASGTVLNRERCFTILSGEPDLLGEYDFFFEWKKSFNPEEYKILIDKIDEALKPLGCLYTLTNK
jgi:hypothetical protein